MFSLILQVSLLSMTIFHVPAVPGHVSREGFMIEEPRQQATISKSKAITLARQYLRSQPFKNQYLMNSAQAHEHPAYWEIWFRRRKPSRPAHGIVRVDKETGEASWQPSR